MKKGAMVLKSEKGSQVWQNMNVILPPGRLQQEGLQLQASLCLESEETLLEICTCTPMHVIVGIKGLLIMRSTTELASYTSSPPRQSIYVFIKTKSCYRVLCSTVFCPRLLSPRITGVHHHAQLSGALYSPASTFQVLESLACPTMPGP